MANLQVSGIIEKMTGKDKDFRYMATSDLLTELNKESFKLDMDLEMKLSSNILKQLDDVAGDVSGLAVKCLAPLVKKVGEEHIAAEGKSKYDGVRGIISDKWFIHGCCRKTNPEQSTCFGLRVLKDLTMMVASKLEMNHVVKRGMVSLSLRTSYRIHELIYSPVQPTKSARTDVIHGSPQLHSLHGLLRVAGTISSSKCAFRWNPMNLPILATISLS
ncbi:hypothetical protein F2Q70_00030693 [Brassica cretica]|uniref:Uncharacterized protein n=1 Tax=Brassica cretica TaxID=69181 RepID=A0A8S9FHA4_BRACR|nr:hypothetical protein F2Q70_00030693 [Brassica cretica]KAF3595101.1 hypothetical protein DY000_02023344 [Brassica cretica]